MTSTLNILISSYDGNSFLCITSNDTCGSSPSSSSKHKKFMIGFIIGGVLLFIIVILAILCFFNRRKTRAHHQTPSGMLFNYPQWYEILHFLLGLSMIRTLHLHFGFSIQIMVSKNCRNQLLNRR